MNANVWIALGANLPSRWGDPQATFRRALEGLQGPNTRLVAISPVYRSKAVGQPHQPPYCNAVAQLRTSLPPAALLRALKQIERAAGRRGRQAPWGPRSLDLDILDYGGMVHGWHGGKPGFARPGQRPLILPHPYLHYRPFALRPLLDLSPRWRHPALRQSGQRLWQPLSRTKDAKALRPLAPA